jgi:hypothetical protein
MNQKEIFVNTLLKLTRENKINWNISNTNKLIEKHNLNSDQISQVYYSYFNSNNIYFIIQKKTNYSLEFDINYEGFTRFINIVNGNEVVYSIYEYEVSENMLNELLEEIQRKFENDFFNNFMKTIE